MQSLNLQPQSFDQFGGTHIPDAELRQGMNMRMFSPQNAPAMLMGQPARGMPTSVDNYMLNKPDNIQDQPGTQQQQQQQQHYMNNGVPPGLNVFQSNDTGSMMRMAGSQMVMGPAAVSHLPSPSHLFVKEVFQENLYAEFAEIRNLISQYNYVAISTEFVGTMARPVGAFRSRKDYHYQTIRSNVDFLNPIQMGISLSDVNGNKPENVPSTWQINFKFDQTKEIVSQESLDLLHKIGIDLDSQRNNGVDVFEFAQLMIDSGLMLDSKITWITFHGTYDFGFLINILMNDIMPNNVADFQWWLKKYIPNFYDLNLIYKIMQDITKQNHHQQQQQQLPQQITLVSLADELGLPRFPLFATTGGQSLLTLLVFVQLGNLSMYKLPNGTEFTHYKNLVYGLDME